MIRDSSRVIGSEMKEVKMSYKIEQHDYGVRLKNTKKFLSSGNRVSSGTAVELGAAAFPFRYYALNRATIP